MTPPGHASDPIANAHGMSERALMEALASSPDGLSLSQAKELLRRHGPNTWEIKQKHTWHEILLRQVKNLLILLLIASAVIAYLAGHLIDAAGILAAVVLSVVFGFAQEYKAEQELSALRKLAAPRAVVIREGRESEVDARELVVGDVIRVSEGDLVPADARLLEGDLSADQSALTGESLPANKKAGSVPAATPMAERTNCLYAGTLIVRGNGKAMVFATSFATSFGRIAKDLAGVEGGQTPLQKRLTGLGENIGKAAVILSLLFFLWGLWRGEDLVAMLLVAVSLAVAAIPEGLPTVMAITLGVGVQRMARERAIVRKMQAVEALGSATVICTDKTGTLTENKMTALRIGLASGDYLIGGGPMELSGRIARSDGREMNALEHAHIIGLLSAGVLCNDASLWYDKNRLVGSRGDPTEVALLVAAHKGGLDATRLRDSWILSKQRPFEYARKMMVQVREWEGQHVSYVKGAPEVVLARCTRILGPEGERPISAADRQRIKTAYEDCAAQALRTLGVARKKMASSKSDLAKEKHGLYEEGLTWLGVVGLMDPPRPEVRAALATCQKAGVRVIMLTGDSPLTARRIAQDLGILEAGKKPVLGDEIDRMSDAQLAEAVRGMAVCARATPDHKFRIVKALQAAGEIVALTGDGVNDAPSIKKADIGVAMGIGGTDVARGSADIILLDNNFGTLVRAVERGRSIFENIRSFVHFQFTTNVAALALMFASPLLFVVLPLKPVQILWINIIMDGPPALALGLEPARSDVMVRAPRRPSAPFLGRPMLASIVFGGLSMAAVTLGIFGYYLAHEPAKAGTMA
ncbi:MAG: cation-translocating P-type ATPase, partial [Candidatus Micrarchaeota archaeon]